MSGGMLGMLTDTIAVQAEVGCDFDTAMQIVQAAYDYDLETAAPADNVIHVDFVNKRRVMDHGLA
jgi:hypothetical protein